MKKLILAAILSSSLLLSARAQTTNGPVDPTPQPIHQVWDFLATGSNWLVAPYGIVADNGKAFGGGIALGYRASQFLVPTLRLDYFDGHVTMPSGNVQLQVPIHIGGLTVIPLVYTGVGTTIGGLGQSNGEAIGIVGAGAAVQIGAHWDLLGAYERRSNFPSGGLLLFGVGYKF